jgi:hypothetical protein
MGIRAQCDACHKLQFGDDLIHWIRIEYHITETVKSAGRIEQGYETELCVECGEKFKALVSHVEVE